MSTNHCPTLVRHTDENYGDAYRSHLLEQYKLYVDSAEKVSDRRVSANNYFLTVNALLVTLYSLVATSPFSTFWIILVPIAGLLVSLTWYQIITSYRNLNTVKFTVIHELEEHLPASLFNYEWSKAKEGRGRKYKPLSHMERFIPFVFMILYVLLAVAGFLGWR
jgi:hypothetical protein